jgi:hypothetical protein
MRVTRERIVRVLLATAIVGLGIGTTLSTPASAWQCMARSTNGAVGVGSGVILERAQKFAIQRCIVAGGNIPGYACSIRYCR